MQQTAAILQVPLGRPPYDWQIVAGRQLPIRPSGSRQLVKSSCVKFLSGLGLRMVLKVWMNGANKLKKLFIINSWKTF